MKRLLHAILSAGSSRAMPPLVIGLFFLLYIGIAFFTDETLITLMAFTRKSFILAALLALIPLNMALCILLETIRHLKTRRVLTGKTADVMPALFDETVDLPASPSFQELQGRLAAVGYRTNRSGNTLAAWRGACIFPARILFLAGTFCLFTGILISITSRTSQRQRADSAPRPRPPPGRRPPACGGRRRAGRGARPPRASCGTGTPRRAGAGRAPGGPALRSRLLLLREPLRLLAADRRGITDSTSCIRRTIRCRCDHPAPPWSPFTT